MQQQKPQLIIDTVTAAPKSELDEVQMLLGRAYSLLGQPAAMAQAYRQYLTDVDDIDQYIASNCLAVIRDLIVAGEEGYTIAQWLVDGKTFAEDYIKRLLEAFCLSHNPAKKTYVKEAADFVKSHWNELEQQLRKALAAIYSDLKEWDTAKTLWRELIGEGNQETEELRIYLLVLFQEHQELVELSARLGYWREHFKPDLMLTLHELQLYRRVNNYQKLNEVAAYGMARFPDQIQFWLDRIEALHHLGDNSALITLLDDRLLTAKLPYHVRLHAAHIYLIHGHEYSGLKQAS